MEIVTAELPKIQVFWFVSLWRWISYSRRFERSYCLHPKRTSCPWRWRKAI